MMMTVSQSCWCLRSQVEIHGVVLSALQTILASQQSYRKRILMLFITTYIIGQTDRHTHATDRYEGSQNEES